ncbi:hypothetical protein XELAEV_18030795mg [Xenopus laevis]|uniref:Uncharacterized protein n=1 Tax=Xenopus laevis TaxID=8355 RepID=A0A974CNQ9_XENLA|nr:hypothetical protein XELAEV_18030795mg [Xenopus laevis]
MLTDCTCVGYSLSFSVIRSQPDAPLFYYHCWKWAGSSRTTRGRGECENGTAVNPFRWLLSTASSMLVRHCRIHSPAFINETLEINECG